MFDLSNFPPILKSEYKPIYIQLSEILTDHIRKNNVPRNTRLPSEKELIEHYNISRQTVRLAFQKLEKFNIVYRMRGKGTFTSNSSEKQSHGSMFQNIEEYYEQLGKTITNKVLEMKTIAPPLKWKDELQLNEKKDILLLRRLKLINNNPLCIELRVLPMDIARQLNRKDLSNKVIFDLINELPNEQIKKIKFGYYSRLINLQEAEELETKAMTPVLVRKSLYYNLQNKPMMLSRFIIIPNQMDLEFIFTEEDGLWRVSSQ